MVKLMIQKRITLLTDLCGEAMSTRERETFD